jgi:hypothetical protein
LLWKKKKNVVLYAVVTADPVGLAAIEEDVREDDFFQRRGDG